MINDLNEFKVVTRQETFNDLAVRELAQARAKCLCRVQNGRCTKDECNSCSAFKMYYNCKQQMSDYDKARLDNYTADYYGRFSRSPSAFMKHKDYCKHYGKIVWLIIACIAGLLILGSLGGPLDTAERPEAKTVQEVSDSFRRDIDFTFERMSNSNLYGTDLTGDGVFNCQDRAVLFKMLWDDLMVFELNADTTFTDYRDWLDYAEYVCSKCILVRNYNVSTGMNHLFVMIYDPNVSKWVTIEPDINWRGMYTIPIVYGNIYDPSYNHYDETEYFMGKVNRKLRNTYRSIK